MTQEFRTSVCKACRSRDCCSHFGVDVTGADIYRISRTLMVPASTFVIYYKTDRPSRAAFALDASDVRYRMALRRRPRPKNKRPCTFLVKLNTGRKVCGLGGLRPRTCQLFPVVPAGEEAAAMMSVYNGPGCWRTWHLGEIDIGKERPRLTARKQEFDIYARHVATWNKQVATLEEGRWAPFDSFVEYILNRYAARDLLLGASSDTA